MKRILLAFAVVLFPIISLAADVAASANIDASQLAKVGINVTGQEELNKLIQNYQQGSSLYESLKDKSPSDRDKIVQQLSQYSGVDANLARANLSAYTNLVEGNAGTDGGNAAVAQLTAQFKGLQMLDVNDYLPDMSSISGNVSADMLGQLQASTGLSGAGIQNIVGSLQGGFNLDLGRVTAGITANLGQYTGLANSLMGGMNIQGMTSLLNTGQFASYASNINQLTAQLGGVLGQFNISNGQLNGLIGANIGSLTNGVLSQGTNLLNGALGNLNVANDLMGQLNGQISGLTNALNVANLSGQLTGQLGSIVGKIGVNGYVNQLTSGIGGSLNGLGVGGLNIGSMMNGGGIKINVNVNSVVGQFMSSNGMTGSLSNVSSLISGGGKINAGQFMSGAISGKIPLGSMGLGQFAKNDDKNKAPEDPKVDGIQPYATPDAFCDEQNECKNLLPVYDGPLHGTTSKEPVTMGGSDESVAQRLTFWSKTNATRSLEKPVVTVKKDVKDGAQIDGNSKIEYDLEFPKEAPSFGAMYAARKQRVDEYLRAHGDDGGLVQKEEEQDTSVKPHQSGAVTTDLETNKLRKNYNTLFKEGDAGEEEMIESGKCQLVQVPNGRYTVYKLDKPEPVKTADGKFRYNKKWQLVKDGKAAPSGKQTYTVEVERVVDPSHPYSPRHNFTQNFTSSAIGDLKDKNIRASNGQQKLSITNICGRDKQQYLGNIRTWEQFGGIDFGELKGDIKSQLSGMNREAKSTIYTINTIAAENTLMSNSETDVNGVKGLSQNYYYYTYTQDDGSSDFKNGLIVADDARKAAYTSLNSSVYTACYAACMAATGGAASSVCEQLCSDVSQYTACRAVILPPVKPVNVLKMAYNLEGVEPVDEELPFIYKQKRASFDQSSRGSWAQGVSSNGFSFYASEPFDTAFKFAGPWVKHWPTGVPASKPVVDKYEPSKWEPWRTTLIGVNSEALPDESNIMEGGVHNMSGQIGGWEELKLYQARCMQDFGLNCICDYQLNRAHQTGLGYGMAAYSGNIPTENANYVQVKGINPEKYQSHNAADNSTYLDNKYADVSDQHKYQMPVNLSGIAEMKFRLPVVIGGKPFNAMLGHPMADGEIWPGKSGKVGTLSSGQVRKGDILYYDTLSSSGGSGTKMPPNAVFVQNVMGKCIMVKRFDGGTVLDSAGGSELSGIAKQQEWCLEDGEPTFTLKGYKGSSKLLPCTYTWAQKCYVNNPGEWNIYRRNDDKRKGFDPITGEEIKS